MEEKIMLNNMLSKRFIFVFIFLFSTLPVFSWLGSGTEADPYQIWNKADLEAIADTVEFYIPTLGYMGNNWTRDKNFILMADITDSVRKQISRCNIFNYFIYDSSFFFI
jgi:hypothetical protein